MGFLIFAFRKLDLKRRINDKQFSQMLLSNKQQQITSQISNMEQSMSSAQSTLSSLTSGSIMNLQQQVMSQCVGADGKAIEGVNQAAVMMQMQAKQQAMMFQSNTLNSVFDAVSKAQLKQLHNEDTSISQQMASLESQLKVETAELANVEKSEDEAAKSTAPKFGLS